MCTMSLVEEGAEKKLSYCRTFSQKLDDKLHGQEWTDSVLENPENFVLALKIGPVSVVWFSVD